MSDAVDFKDCTRCAHQWRTCADFVRDRELEINGYQASLGYPEEGLILVTHVSGECGTTLAVRAEALKPLYQGPLFTEFCAGEEACERRCLEEGDLEECSAPCAMAWVRVVLQYLRRHELPGRQ